MATEKQRRKRKPLILIACKGDEQWPDYVRAVYPLLRKFGCFDCLVELDRKHGLSTPATPRLQEADEQR
jgi:hypothetical protein